jgi:predicted TIM-barrel fold metal-dependent hydrolase
MVAAINLMLAPTCRTFPGLKIVFSEGGIGWAPAAIERADRQVIRHRSWCGIPDPLPSEIFRRNMWVCMIEEPVGIRFRHDIGIDKILWECDYPHADTPWPHAQKGAAEVFADVPPAEVDAITHGNAERLFRWQMADPALAAIP